MRKGFLDGKSGIIILLMLSFQLFFPVNYSNKARGDHGVRKGDSSFNSSQAKRKIFLHYFSYF